MKLFYPIIKIIKLKKLKMATIKEGCFWVGIKEEKSRNSSYFIWYILCLNET